MKLQSGDLFIFTTLSGTGVDIQALWQDSKSVMPPHHLNFLNPISVDVLLARLGFESLSITTPGKLDIDILANNFNLSKTAFGAHSLRLPHKSRWKNGNVSSQHQVIVRT